jgi:hypothetical protein
LIFFVTFLHQGKKVKGYYSKGNFRAVYQTFILLEQIINHYIDYLVGHYGFTLIKGITDWALITF